MCIPPATRTTRADIGTMQYAMKLKSGFPIQTQFRGKTGTELKDTKVSGRKKLYLITHAHTRQVPGTDAARWRLSDMGCKQAAALAQQPFWQQVDRLLLSSEPKARLTVAPLLQSRSLPVQEDARFDELRRTPEWTDDYTARVAELFRRPQESIAGWEPAAQALARFRVAIAEWTSRHPQETLALVGHGLTFSLYWAHLLGLPRVDLRDWQALPFAAVACVVDGQIVGDFSVPPAVPRVPTGAAAERADPLAVPLE